MNYWFHLIDSTAFLNPRAATVPSLPKCQSTCLTHSEAAAAAAAKSLQSCLTLCDPIDGSPPGSPIPGILQARTQVGCHFLLQCMKVKSESEVSQTCPTLSDPMDCSLPGSSICGIFQARVLEWGAIAFSTSPHWESLIHLLFFSLYGDFLHYFFYFSLVWASYLICH